MEDGEEKDNFDLTVTDSLREEDRIRWIIQKVLDESKDSGISDENLAMVEKLKKLFIKMFEWIRLESVNGKHSWYIIRMFLEVIDNEVKKI